MKIWCFKIPTKGEISAEIQAETEEQAREILKTDDWEVLDKYCFDFDFEIDQAVLTAAI